MRMTPKIKVSGYFDDSVPELACSMNRPDYLEILTHEYCHLTQWRDQCEPWVKCGESIYYIDQWLSGKQVRGIKKYLALARDLELDNEIRAVEMIRKFNLPIDVNRYTRKANAYVMYYNYLYYSRKWCNSKRSPYNNQPLIDAMSDKFDMPYHTLPKHIKAIFLEQKI